MSWYFFAFLSPLLWATSNHIDKYIISRYLKGVGTGVLAIFAGSVAFLFSLGTLILFPHDISGIGLLNGTIIVINGALLIVAFIPYYYALNGEDASSVVPLYQAIPIFSLILGYIFLKESVTPLQLIAGICIIIGAILITIDFEKTGFHIKKKVLFLMLLSSLLLSVHFLVFKYVALNESFIRTVFWEYIGAVLVAVYLFLGIKEYRKQFMGVLRENSIGVIFINIFNEGINIAAKIFANYATLLVPVVVVNLANGLQPLFVFVIGIMLTVFFPLLGKEQISRRHLAQRIIAIVILLAGTYLLVK